MKRGPKPKSSVSDTRLSEIVAPPSAEIISHEVCISASSVANKISYSSSPLPTNTNLSVASSGSSEGVGFPPTDHASFTRPEGRTIR